MGGVDRAGTSRLRQPQLAPNEGLAAVPQDRQHQGLSAALGSYEAGEHGPLSGRRAGRCPGAFGGVGNLGAALELNVERLGFFSMPMAWSRSLASPTPPPSFIA